MSQHFWIERRYTDDKSSTDRCVRIVVPDKCPHCGVRIRIAVAGSANNATTLDGGCDHTFTYGDIWEMRIVSATPSKVIKYVDVCPCGIHPSRCDYHQ